MNKRSTLFTVVVHAFFLLASCASPPDVLERPDLTVASFNIHYISLRNDVLPWDERKEAVRTVLAGLDADIIAFQEMETFTGGSVPRENIQLEYLLENLPRYEAAAVGDPLEYPSTQPVFYDPTVVRPIEQGFFFFSPTPNVIYSRSWSGRFPAFSSWVLFEHIPTARIFYLFNIHFDAGSASDRRMSADLTIERVGIEVTDEPVIVAGDFNAPLMFPTMGRFLDAGFRHAGIRAATFHFNRGLHLYPAIDHILARGPVLLEQGSVVRERVDGRWPSDHHPVVTRVQFTEP